MKLLKTFQNWKQSLNEAISDVVYHITTLEKAVAILREDKFLLAFAYDDLEARDKEFYFRMSFARTPTSGFPKFRNPHTGATVFTIDGRKLNQKYKSKQYNYWKDAQNLNQISKREAEDRLISKNEYVDEASKYILDIGIFIQNPFEDSRKPTFKECLESLKEENIDTKMDFIDLILYCKEKRIPLIIYITKETLWGINKKKGIEIDLNELSTEWFQWMGMEEYGY